MKKVCIAVAFMLVLGQLVNGSADAASATSTLNVSVSVGEVCTVSSTAVDFGSWEGVSLTSNGSITVTCPSGTPYNIALDAGLNPSNMWRGMSNGTDVLLYGLYKVSTFNSSEEWGDIGYGDTYPYGSPLADTGTGAAQLHTVFGGLMEGNNPSPVSTGSYTDVVQVTVHY